MIPRKDTEYLLRQADRHSITILTGSRQVGKSTLMQVLRERIKADSAWYNLENPSHLTLFNEGYASFIRQNKARLVFIDEFQYCPSISSTFKAIYDLNPEIKIYASGSSSLEIQSHLRESLVGRKQERVIYPLTFSEWLTHFDGPEVPDLEDNAPVDIHDRIKGALAEFLRFGAMPGLTQFKDEIEKREYLDGIYRTYIATDIKSFLKNESVLSFNKMVSYLALNNGTLLNKNTLSTVSGVSSRQIDRHLEVMEGTFVLSLVRPLARNGGKELTKTPKYYFYDQGVLNSIIQDFRPQELRGDSGILNEQFAYWELKKNLDIRYQIKYWRTADGKEVDFVLEKDKELVPIEVKSAWPAGKIPPGLSHFLKNYPDTRTAVVLYDGKEHSTRYIQTQILFLPLYKACRIGALL